MKRARAREQKDERRNAIMEEAWRHYHRAPYAEITVAGIARGIGLAKGTVYLYFSGKESLFLAVLTAQLSDWFAELSGILHAVAANESPAGAHPSGRAAAVSQTVARSLGARPTLARLLAESHVILEQNADGETIAAYKKMLLDELGRIAAPFARALGSRDKETAMVVLLEVYALLVGAQQLAAPAPLVREVIEQSEELSLFSIDFERFFGKALHALLVGALAQETGAARKEKVYE
jgi:AcrR family transcriptional regulator